MSVYHRESKYLQLLTDKSYTVKELADKLFVSEPTVRRDILELKEKELVTCKRGLVELKNKYGDARIAMFVRDMEHQKEKKEIAIKAAAHIRDGNTIMMDASTTAYCLVPHLSNFKNILLITNGIKTASHAVSMGIKTICVGGEISMEDFACLGYNCETMLKQYNADIAFFSCQGITENGDITNNSVQDNALRRIMLRNAKKNYLLCDKSKFNKTCLHTLCNIKELDGLITN